MIGPLLAAGAAGFGGLLVELAAVRRIGLIGGNTVEAAAWVVGVFLLGLGGGGLVVAARPRLRARATAWAAAAYAGVALAILVGDGLLRALGPLPGVATALVTLAHPGIAALLMGCAFPLLFAGSASAGLLIAANLAGSVVACAVGGNWIVPELGLTASHALGAGAYGVAALAALTGPRAAAVRHDPAPVLPASSWLAAGLAGFATIGFEILLLRRLPFFLEGFQPTLSGVLAVCLLGLSLGAALVPLLRRVAPRAGPGTLLVVAAVGMSLGLHEQAAPAIGRLPVASDLGLHARIWLAALVASAPACVALGAVVPLAVDAASPPVPARAAVAGRLFFAQGVGAVVGSLVASRLVPWLAPAAVFAILPLLLGVSVVGCAPASARARVLGGAAVLLLSAFGVSGAGRPWAPQPPVAGSRFDRPERYRYLEHRTDSAVTASVVYDRAAHSMVLFTDEFRAAYTGPGTEYMKVLGHLPFVLREGLRDVAVIALGTGTTAHAVCSWPDPETVHVVEISGAVLSLVDRFGGDGPVPTGEPAAFSADPRTVVHLTDGRRWLARTPRASLDLVMMEPLLPYAPGTAPLYSREFYACAKRALRPGGLVVQWVPTHAMPREFFETLLGTFGRAFAYTSAWLVDQSTLLVGSDVPHLPSRVALAARLEAAPPLAARMLHEAGLARPVDFEVVHLGTGLREEFGVAPVLTDDRPFLERIGYWSGERRLSFFPDNVERLAALIRPDGWGGTAERAEMRRARLRAVIARARAVLPPVLGGLEPEVALAELAPARLRAPDSVVLHREESLAWRLARERRVMTPPFDGLAAAEVARRQLERDEGSALLVACTAFAPDADRAAALAAAHAIDPTLFLEPNRLPFTVRTAIAGTGPLEDLARLPVDPEELVRLAAQRDPLGAALRAAFAVRGARAAVALAARRPVGAARALGSVFDPASLDAFAAAVSGRGGDVLLEAGPLWRTDLPMPEAFALLVRSAAVEARRALASVIGGHRGPRALSVLADLLEDGDAGVREAAAAALFRSLRDRVAYDPTWPESRLREAARAVRALHNRGR